MMKIAPAIVWLCVALAASPARAAGPEGGNAAFRLGPYRGTLPCADCRGILSELTLYRASRHGLPAGYTLRETYLGTREGDKTFDSRGQWYVLRGSAADPDATVYQLVPEPAGEERHFLKVGEKKLRALTRELAELPPAMPRTLARVRAN